MCRSKSDKYLSACNKLYSTDDDALAQASERQYDALIIDGDHTYAGVKSDFDLYAYMVRIGGFILFDDYGAHDWPDVKALVDKEVEPCNWLSHVGSEFRTAVYRVTQSDKAS